MAQIIGTNKWLINDYHKFVEVKSIMTDIAESINDSTNKGKPVVVLGAIPPSDKIQKEACVSYDSWQYRVISLMTDWMDPTLKEKYHNYYDNSLGYYFVESPLLSVLNWAGGAFPDEEGRAHEQFTELWSLLGYEGITYADQQTEDMAREIWIDKKMVGYPEEGYIYEDDNVIIISLSQY